jgi:hypothetical protein
MTDHQAARIRTHQQNLDRYCRLLATDLTDLEREFLHKRIAQERLELERIKAQANSDTAMAFIAAQAFAKGGRSHK